MAARRRVAGWIAIAGGLMTVVSVLTPWLEKQGLSMPVNALELEPTLGWTVWVVMLAGCVIAVAGGQLLVTRSPGTRLGWVLLGAGIVLAVATLVIYSDLPHFNRPDDVDRPIGQGPYLAWLGALAAMVTGLMELLPKRKLSRPQPAGP